MYSYPYGDDQQLNLNWIINEIINLHKQLDPDYETPSFTQVYPYSNLNRLNLDWVLTELKALKELAPEPVPTDDIQAVAEALVALPFDSSKSYQIYDFISRDGEIWRATEPITAGGAWDETKWFKTKLGTDLAVLDRWINAINANLTTLQNTVENLSSDEISDDSDAGGATVKESLNNLKGSLNTIQGNLAHVLTSNVADETFVVGDLLVYNNQLYRVMQAIPSGSTVAVGTNIKVADLQTMDESGAGYLRKADGTLICWGNFSVSISDFSPYGAYYQGAVNPNVTFAKPFISAPNIVVTPFTNVWHSVLQVGCSSTGISNITVERQNTSPVTISEHYIAIGRWK